MVLAGVSLHSLYLTSLLFSLWISASVILAAWGLYPHRLPSYWIVAVLLWLLGYHWNDFVELKRCPSFSLSLSWIAHFGASSHHVVRTLKQPVEKATWAAAGLWPATSGILEEGLPAPGQPSDDCSLTRDPEPEMPICATPEYLTQKQ